MRKINYRAVFRPKLLERGTHLMKKNIVRVLSLVLVAAMIFAFASCTTNLNIRFVDKDGNDISIGAISPATEAPATDAPVTDAPATSAPTPDTPTETPATDAPATDAPATDAPATNAPATEAPATDAPATEAPATEAPATNTVPTTKDEIVAFYAKAVNDIANNGSASYNKKEFQTMGDINVTGIGFVDNQIKNVAANYFHGEDQVETQVAEKGTDSSKSKMLGWNLSDNSKVASATLNQNGGNYDITIVMVDEDTPHKGGGSHLDAVGSVLLWEDIDAELQGVSILSDYQDIHVRYTNYTINATISPDGKISSIKHHTDIKIDIGSAKILVATLKNKSVGLENTVIYNNFAY